MISTIAIYIGAIIAYFFLCRLTPTLNQFLSELKDNVFQWANSLKDSYDYSYVNECKKPWNTFNKSIVKYSVERKDLMKWQTIALLLLIFNTYMLTEFMNAVSPGLAISLTPFWFIIPITYGTLGAAIIVLVEIVCGSLYCYSYFEYEKNPNIGIYSVLKFLGIFIMICMGIVECVFWARVSVVTEIGDMLGINERNIINSFIDYFLALLGAAITLTEFCVGYMIFKLREYAPPKSVVGQKVKYALSTLLYFLMFFVSSIICRLFSGFLLLISWLLKLFVIPGNFIYENITKKYS